MIEIFLFFLILLGGLYGFTKNWIYLSLKDGFLGLAVYFLMFIIGWAFASTLANLVYPYEWRTQYFNHNTLALVTLIIPKSYFFYKFFYKGNLNLNKKDIKE
jgi:hypothetical protein